MMKFVVLQMNPTDGLKRGMNVIDWRSTSCSRRRTNVRRVFNVLGEVIDEKSLTQQMLS